MGREEQGETPGSEGVGGGDLGRPGGAVPIEERDGRGHLRKEELKIETAEILHQGADDLPSQLLPLPVSSIALIEATRVPGNQRV